MLVHKQKLDWCLAKENRMKKIKPNDKLSEEHIHKAKHNLRAADYNIKGLMRTTKESECGDSFLTKNFKYYSIL